MLSEPIGSGIRTEPNGPVAQGGATPDSDAVDEFTALADVGFVTDDCIS
jgi:hypothetical protein